MKEPLISVIIPIHNSASYLQKCLDSLMYQTFVDFEGILIDSGSDDESLSIANKAAYDDTRLHVISIEHKDAGYCRNLGLAQAKGKYIVFWDSDDWFEPRALEYLFYKAEATSADIVFCGYNVYDEKIKKKIILNNDLNRTFFPKETVYNSDTHPDITFGLSRGGMVWNQIFRREFLLENNLKFQEQPSINDAFFRYSAEAVASKITYIDRRLINYRTNVAGSISLNRETNLFDGCAVIEKLYAFLQEKGKLPRLRQAFLNAALSIMYYSVRIKSPLSDFLEDYYVSHQIKEYKMIEEGPEFYPFNPAAREWLFKLHHRHPDITFLKTFYETKRENIIPIVMVADNNCAAFVSVTIQSIIEHANDAYFYDIYILNQGLSGNIAFMLERIKKENIRVKLINIRKKAYAYEADKFNIKIISFLLLPEIFSGYDKVLYFDLNVIAQCDVSECYNTDIQQFALAGAIDMPTLLGISENKTDIPSDQYVNSNVLLINLQYWREHQFEDKIYKSALQHVHSNMSVQDILNIVCNKRICYLPYQWNAFNISINDVYSDILDLINYNKIVNTAKILNFISSQKPWKYENCLHADIWWKYARNSLFYEYIIRGCNEQAS